MAKAKTKKKLEDATILDALTKLGGKVTATDLSKILGHPERSIRYRLKRLKEKGYLGRLWIQTHDTKIGLGDAAIVFNMNEKYRNLPREFLFKFPNLYAHYATYGRFNGYLTSCGYPIVNPQIVDRIVRVMKKMNIINDAYIFNTVDFISLAGDLSKYNPKIGWNWDWKEWVKQCEKTIKIGERFQLEFDTNPAQFDYNHKDIELIAEMKISGSITHKELSAKVGISETQVGVRIRRLREANVLRGSAWLVEETPMSVVLFTYLELEELDNPALSCFLHLPFRKELVLDSSDRFCVRLTMNSSDVVGYLRGFETIRSHFRSFFIQTAVNIKVVPGGMHGFYHLHKESTGKWEMPVEEYINDLEKFVKKH